MPNQFDDSDNEIPNASTCLANSQRQQALYLLRTATQLSLTHSGTDVLYESTQNFISNVLDQVLENVLEKLEEQNTVIDDAMQQSITQTCSSRSLIDGLTTRATREAYYRRHLNYVVSCSNTYSYYMYTTTYLHISQTHTCTHQMN